MIYIGLLIVFFLEYTRPHDLLPFIVTIKLYSVLPILLFLTASFQRSRISNAQVWSSLQAKMLIVFLLMSLLAIGLGWNRMMAQEMFTTILGYLLLFFLVAKSIDSTERVRGLFVMLIAIHVYLIARNPDIVLSPDVRDYIQHVAFLGDGNDFALSVVIVIPMCLYVFSSSRSKVLKLLVLAVGGLLLFSIMGSQSRGATLALGGVGIYLWTQSRRKGIGILIGGLVVGVVLVFASDVYLSRLSTISQYEQEGSAVGRIEAWKAAIWMANHNPVFGVGAGGFQMGHAAYHHGESKAAHSMYFHVLGEYGYVGLVMLLMFLINAYRMIQRQIRNVNPWALRGKLEKERSLLVYMNASLIGFSIAAAFLSVFYYPHLYVMGGLCLAVNQIVDSRMKAMLEAEKAGSGASDAKAGKQVSELRLGALQR